MYKAIVRGYRKLQEITAVSAALDEYDVSETISALSFEIIQSKSVTSLGMCHFGAEPRPPSFTFRVSSLYPGAFC